MSTKVTKNTQKGRPSPSNKVTPVKRGLESRLLILPIFLLSLREFRAKPDQFLTVIPAKAGLHVPLVFVRDLRRFALQFPA